MGKIWIEVCLISARGLRRSSSLWKLQWFAVGWVDPNNKYLTKIDSCGNSNPVWRTKFAASFDDSASNPNELALNVEVYSREPIFLRERLQGTATILLREFLVKREKASEEKEEGEIGSYQLRRGSSNKPQGFIDVSIRVSEDNEERSYSFLGNEKHGNSITLATGDGPSQAFPAEIPLSSLQKPAIQFQPHTNHPHSHPHPMTFPPNYPMVRNPPLPFPTSNIGYKPSFLPGQNRLSDTYINVPSSSAAPPRGRGGGGPGVAMGLGAGALAAGAVIFGEDFLPGFDVSAGFTDPTLVVSTDPPF